MFQTQLLKCRTLIRSCNLHKKCREAGSTTAASQVRRRGTAKGLGAHLRGNVVGTRLGRASRAPSLACAWSVPSGCGCGPRGAGVHPQGRTHGETVHRAIARVGNGRVLLEVGARTFFSCAGRRVTRGPDRHVTGGAARGGRATPPLGAGPGGSPAPSRTS